MKALCLVTLAASAVLVAPALAQQSAGSGQPDSFVANRAVVQDVEQRLAAMGYPVEVDGNYDANLRNNVLRYQSEHGLRPTGDIDLSTLGTMGIALEPAGNVPVAVVEPPPTVIVAEPVQTAQLPPDYGFPMLRNEHMSAPQITKRSSTPVENDIGLTLSPQDWPSVAELQAGETPPGMPAGFPVQSFYQ